MPKCSWLRNRRSTGRIGLDPGTKKDEEGKIGGGFLRVNGLGNNYYFSGVTI